MHFLIVKTFFPIIENAFNFSNIKNQILILKIYIFKYIIPNIRKWIFNIKKSVLFTNLKTHQISHIRKWIFNIKKFTIKTISHIPPKLLFYGRGIYISL